MKTSALIGVIVVGLAGAGVFFLSIAPAQAPGPGGDSVACTADAMQCTDGSYVGRTGPNCEFVCPSATTTPPTGGGGGGILPYNSGIQGVVMAGPTCPVERDPPDPACADKPIQTNIWISRKITPQQVIATTYSDANGAFQILLPPGDYVIQAGPSGVPLPRCGDTSATVGASGYTVVAISCDTGIR
ncbi:hypothetical protein A2765_00175 [Candidatus Kaiserbacteria bacterium RIFCSPHIGHO2_01_FULL_56_24]|uniref:Carboxypeptidase regulatory-like domain-containing protein n=1 Tax=Candidatus Kaiserbacteria bacterium RIFCSPHIGHO2_01_FULL_56_24 TaxID=1798487 RepID=A0A1F6D8I1_9BACT|nr:MAG: hypothetical protein A2765_00175 [Candidatus Kaiserbacteria bacterium RIFCSPHIGHO2_01_FULL_56_24]